MSCLWQYHIVRISIYSSIVSNSVYDIFTDLQDADISLELIKVAIFAVAGQEHYEALCPLDKVPSSPSHSAQASGDGCSTRAINNVRTSVSINRKDAFHLHQ